MFHCEMSHSKRFGPIVFLFNLLFLSWPPVILNVEELTKIFDALVLDHGADFST